MILTTFEALRTNFGVASSANIATAPEAVCEARETATSKLLKTMMANSTTADMSVKETCDTVRAKLSKTLPANAAARIIKVVIDEAGKAPCLNFAPATSTL